MKINICQTVFFLLRKTRKAVVSFLIRFDILAKDKYANCVKMIKKWLKNLKNDTVSFKLDNETRCQFHQHFTSSFYTSRSQERKKMLDLCINMLVKFSPESILSTFYDQLFWYESVLCHFYVVIEIVFFWRKENWHKICS